MVLKAMAAEYWGLGFGVNALDSWTNLSSFLRVQAFKSTKVCAPDMRHAPCNLQLNVATENI